MKINQKGLDLIKSSEGLRLKAYLDSVNIPTIGYGATFYEDGSKVTLQDTLITVQRAENLLHHHLAKFEAAVMAVVHVPINEDQFSALVCFCYNVGQGAFSASTLVKLLNKGDVQGAADQFLVWNKAGGKVLPGLDRRRHAERDLFLAQYLPSGPSESEINAKLKALEPQV